jgi:transcriptional regulator with XRE-family HTH domain
MLTSFGKEVRKLRLDSNPPMKLKDLAKRLAVSSAYLSGVETGDKSPSPTLVDKVADALRVDIATRRNLHRLAAESMKVVQLDLSSSRTNQRDLATQFARRFSTLNEDQVSEMLKIIERDEQDQGRRRKM